jgi:site-specific DNA-adenine methylase
MNTEFWNSIGDQVFKYFNVTSLRGLIRSKTFWFNVITGALELANTYGTFVPAGSVTTLSIVGNVLLRFMTDTSLASKVQADK